MKPIPAWREERLRQLTAWRVTGQPGRPMPGTVTITEAARRLHVHRRTIQRDLVILRQRQATP